MHWYRGALAAFLLGCLSGGTYAADHREAPAVSLRPAADLADVYVFQSPNTPGNIVLIMTVNPNSDPDFSRTYAFDPEVLYRFGIDTNGDARFDRKIDVLFEPVEGGVQDVQVRLDLGQRIAVGKTTPGSITTPVEPTIFGSANVKAFAGLVDDPFFFDGIGFQRFLAGVGGFRGEDSFGGFNVSAIAIELPFSMINSGSQKIQVAALTYEQVFPTSVPVDGRRITIAERRFEQLERTGVPGVSTAFVPPPLRDEFNVTRPFQDADRFGSVIVETLKRLGTPDANIAILASVAVPDTLKFDFSQPSGFPNGRLPEDDVINTVLSLVLDTAVSDGVDANDVPFRDQFPYLGEPHLPN